MALVFVSVLVVSIIIVGVVVFCCHLVAVVVVLYFWCALYACVPCICVCLFEWYN